MSKTLEQILNAENNRKVGNHRIERVPNGRKFYLYSTCICETRVIDGIAYYTIDNSYGSATTTRATKEYAKHFEGKGYHSIKSL